MLKENIQQSHSPVIKIKQSLCFSMKFHLFVLGHVESPTVETYSYVPLQTHLVRNKPLSVHLICQKFLLCFKSLPNMSYLNTELCDTYCY